MIVVYVAGPFRARSQWQIAENVRAAERVGLLVAECGAMPLIPHANTAHFHGLFDDQFWIDGTKELLRRCDASVYLPGWRNSQGSLGEWREHGTMGRARLALDDYHHREWAGEILRTVEWVKERGKENHPEKR